MTEPVTQVTDKDVLAIIGAKEVELVMLRQQVVQLQAKVKELTTKAE